MELEKLAAFDDEATLREILDIKKQNKIALKEYLMSTQGTEINENSIYDIQSSASMSIKGSR